MNPIGQFDRTVDRLISRYGGKGVLTIFTNGVYLDGEVTRTSTNYDVNIAIFDYPQSMAGDKSNFGTLVLEGDKQCYMQPVNKADANYESPVIKANRDLIKIEGVEWKILTLKEINPSSANTIVYDLHLRK